MNAENINIGTNETTTPNPVKAGLRLAILEAQRAVNAVGKNSTNAFHKYDYASAEHMLVESKRALLESGVQVDRGTYTLYELSGNLICKMEMELAHPESGERETKWIEYPVIPDKGRPLDKALNSALTTSMAYWLRDLLLIPRLDAEEVCARDDRSHEPKTARDSLKAQTRRADTNAVKNAFPGSTIANGNGEEKADPATIAAIKADFATLREHAKDKKAIDELESDWMGKAMVTTWEQIGKEPAAKIVKALEGRKAKLAAA
jgi:hypothetical protein